MRLILIFFVGLNSILFGQVDLNKKIYNIEVVDKKTLKIDTKELKVGQSGIIINNYMDNENTIIGSAFIKSIAKDHSILEFRKNDIFDQNAIPRSKMSPKNGDKFVANHLYNNSLLIVPNNETKKVIKKIYTNQKFFNEDFFASYLKLNDTPIPKKNDMIEFCKAQQIGTIFIVANNFLYILDANSFTLIDKNEIDFESNDIVLPFFTKIKEIERGFWDFGDERIKNYDKHYIDMIGIK